MRTEQGVTVASRLAGGRRPSQPAWGLRVTLPDARSAIAIVGVAEQCAVSVRPPNPIPVLYAIKASAADVRMAWIDAPADWRNDTPLDYLVFRSTTAPSRAFASLPDVANSPARSEETLDPDAVGSLPPFSMLHFYRVSARNAAGNSGDLP